MKLLSQSITEYISTNLDQPYTPWDEATTYSADEYVLYENYFYKCIVENNISVLPSLNTGKWLLMGVDNAYAGIDLNSSTATTIDDGLTEIILRFDALGHTNLAFGGIEGGTLTVDEYDSGSGLIATNDYVLDSVDTATDLLCEPYQPTVSEVEITLTTDADGDADIASMISGVPVDIGATEYGVKIDVIDYSVKTTDEYGITTLNRRRSRETMEVDIVSDAIQTQPNKRAVKNVLGTALMFVADPSTDSKYDNLIILGYVDSYNMYIDNGVISRARMRIEEVL